MNAWVRTDKIEEMIGALRLATESVERSELDPQQWRWAVLGLHMALQGSLVSALKTTVTDGAAVLDPAIAMSWRRWRDDRTGSTDAPKLRLAPLSILLRNAEDPELLPAPFTLRLSEHQRVGVQRLSLLRNEYAHFSLDGWSIDVGMLRSAAMAAVEVIDWLADSKSVFKHRYEEKQRIEVSNLLRRLKLRLSETVLSE